jgi:large subunit ribosomal protein L17
MRHLVKGSKLGRKTGHRKATLRSLASSLIKEHRIQTTVPKAKALRSFIEPLITRAKEDTQHNRRQVFSKLQNKHAVTMLFEEIGPKAADRPGGYTRVLKTGFRAGDGAEQAIIELVDYNDVKPEGTGSTRKRTRRAGRKKKTTSATPDTQAKKEEDSTDEEE